VNAGGSFMTALEQAKANSRRDGMNRYLWKYAGVYWVEQDRPTGDFGSFAYAEVHSDGTHEYKWADINMESEDGQA